MDSQHGTTTNADIPLLRIRHPVLLNNAESPAQQVVVGDTAEGEEVNSSDSDSDDDDDDFIPLIQEEERAENLPKLDFRPLALTLKYLIPLMIWQFLCLSGVITLAVLRVIGYITTVLWRGTLQSFNRILPYGRMANVPTHEGFFAGIRISQSSIYLMVFQAARFI
ncbi:hypothetical protein QBC38DRAFT_461586 [Podospora fimiseda]|uniref:Uncharacterized protein n=1 Tax=Podospora fimiseda TaxID=252190 RepID=A0AAN6YLK6_9PEZI|nr:hypothetical protein QBC38DRAFT_461586 [Podospora fimiseda]